MCVVIGSWENERAEFGMMEDDTTPFFEYVMALYFSTATMTSTGKLQNPVSQSHAVVI